MAVKLLETRDHGDGVVVQLVHVNNRFFEARFFYEYKMLMAEDSNEESVARKAYDRFNDTTVFTNHRRGYFIYD